MIAAEAAQAGVDTTAVLVALISAMALIGVALIEQVRRTRKVAERTHDSVGTKNGMGNVVDMLERLVRGQAQQDERLVRLEVNQLQIRERLQLVEDDLSSLEDDPPAA